MYFLRFTGQKSKIVETGFKRFSRNNIDIIDMPWDLIKNKFLGKLCHIHLSPNMNSKWYIPLKCIWYKLLLSNISQKTEACIILNAHLYSFGDKRLIAYIKKRYPQCKVVLMFSDKYDYFKKKYKTFPTIRELKKIYDLVLTYNIIDAQKYDIKVVKPLIPDYSKVKINETIPKSDLFFVGQEKGRLKELINIYEKCQDNKLLCDFHVMGVDYENQKYSDKIVYNQWMNYDEVLEHVKRTNCIIDLVQKDTIGITTREYEAFGNGKLLLTDNYAIKETDFYSEDQVIWVEDLCDSITQIKRGCIKSKNLYSEYSEEEWYKWLEEELKK